MEPAHEGPDDLTPSVDATGGIYAAMEPAHEGPDDLNMRKLRSTVAAAAMEPAHEGPDDEAELQEEVLKLCEPQWSRPTKGRMTPDLAPMLHRREACRN